MASLIREDRHILWPAMAGCGKLLVKMGITNQAQGILWISWTTIQPNLSGFLHCLPFQVVFVEIKTAGNEAKL